MYRTLLIATVLGLVTACASNGGGLSKRPDYQEVQVSELRHRIAYREDGDDLEGTIDRTLFRAAEVTLSQGYDWFDVIDLQAGYITERGAFWPEGGYGRDRIVRRQCSPLTCRERFYEIPRDINVNTRSNAVQTYSVIEIRIGKGVQPDSRNVHDARWIKASINP